MRTKSTFFKTTTILSTALFSLLGGCLVEDQVDYTTDYGSSSTTANQSDTGSTTADTGSTTTDTGSTTTDTGSTTEETTEVACAIDSLVDLGWEDGIISQNGKYVLQGLDGGLKRYDTTTGVFETFDLTDARRGGNYAPAGITDDGNTVFIRTWNGYSVETQSVVSNLAGRLYSFNLTTSQGQILDVDQNGNDMTHQGWSLDAGDVDYTGDGKYVVFALRDRVDPNDWNAGQQTHIYRKNTQTGEVTKVDTTTDEFEVGYSGSPKISQDGRYVVFNTNINLLNDPNHTGTSDSNLFRKDLDTNEIVWVSGYNNNGLMADINSDGSVIAMHTGSYTVSLWQNGMTSTTLSSSLYPQMSPDGQYLALHNTNYSSEGYTKLYNINSGEFESVPNEDMFPVLEEGYSKHESIISVGNRGLIFSSRHSYVPTDNDSGNTSYYYYEYNCPTE